jgi:hypothetical protein
LRSRIVFRQTPEELREFDEETKRLERERRLSLQRAIRKTSVAYDIVETDEDGRPAMPRMGKDGPQWIPVVWNHREQVTFIRGGKQYEERLGENDGVTYNNGITLISDKSFRSPDELALLLFHEKQHFDLFGTEGVVGVKSRAEIEEMVLLRVRANLVNISEDESERRRLIRKVDAQIVVCNEKKRRHDSALARIGDRARRRLGIAPDADMEPGYSFDIPKDEIDRILGEASDLDRQIRDEEDARRAAEDSPPGPEAPRAVSAAPAYSLPPIPAKPAVPAFDIPAVPAVHDVCTPRSFAEQVRLISERACAAPDDLPSQAVDSARECVLTKQLEPDFMPAGLGGGCPGVLFKELWSLKRGEAVSRLQAAWVASRARQINGQQVIHDGGGEPDASDPPKRCRRGVSHKEDYLCD